jgi:hypothetical protein
MAHHLKCPQWFLVVTQRLDVSGFSDVAVVVIGFRRWPRFIAIQSMADRQIGSFGIDGSFLD